MLSAPTPPPDTHLTTALLKAIYNSSFYLVRRVQPPRKKITRHTKRHKTQFQETEQASELDMEGILELPDQQFKTTIFSILRALTYKVDSSM